MARHMFTKLWRVKLNRGGYDSTGTYWGHGDKLYFWEVVSEPDMYGSLRAPSRDAAKRQLLEHIDRGLKFYR